jgi:hypothetical protein
LVIGKRYRSSFKESGLIARGCKSLTKTRVDTGLLLIFLFVHCSIQEVVLAKSVSILCSGHSLTWAELSLLSRFLSTSSWTVLLRELAGAEHDRRAIIMGHNTPARIAAAQRTWLSGHENSFLYALIRARSSNSGDPRDKVYSQLGLGDARIVPDYHASVAEVYTTTAEYILNNSKSLLLLTCIEGTEFQKVPGLPSWVPDCKQTSLL